LRGDPPGAYIGISTVDIRKNGAYLMTNLAFIGSDLLDIGEAKFRLFVQFLEATFMAAFKVIFSISRFWVSAFEIHYCMLRGRLLGRSARGFVLQGELRANGLAQTKKDLHNFYEPTDDFYTEYFDRYRDNCCH
jgi:hypothetical protein